ncbi:UNVERIFIED_CONTAM: hypothetical protein QE387_001322 [Pseudacidovorax intermedius]|nr:hypothetical protein [Pseudacidovorax intermedius]
MTGNCMVYGTSFTSDETWLNKIAYPGYDWSTAVAWSGELQIPENRVFVNTMNRMKEGKANLFSLLGWEAAQFIGLENTSLDGMIISSPRGRVSINPENGFTEAGVYYATVSKDEITGNCILRDLEAASLTESERKGLENNIQSLQNIEANTWLNAYACLES